MHAFYETSPELVFSLPAMSAHESLRGGPKTLTYTVVFVSSFLWMP